MTDSSWKEFIKKSKAKYRTIGRVPCPAFDGEFVYFNKYGWNHLLRKGKNARDRFEQLKRINLMLISPFIIANSKQISEYRTNSIESVQGHFWSFRMNINGDHLRVVVRQLNNGPKHFFSVMYG